MSIFDQFHESEIIVGFDVFEQAVTIYEYYYTPTKPHSYPQPTVPYFYTTNTTLPHKYERRITQLGYLQKLLIQQHKLEYRYYSSCPIKDVNEHLDQLAVMNIELGNPTFNKEGKLYTKEPIALGEPPFTGINEFYYFLHLAKQASDEAAKNREAVKKTYYKKRSINKDLLG